MTVNRWGQLLAQRRRDRWCGGRRLAGRRRDRHAHRACSLRSGRGGPSPTTCASGAPATAACAEEITVRGLGETNPAADNATAEGRAESPRVEIIAQ